MFNVLLGLAPGQSGTLKSHPRLLIPIELWLLSLYSRPGRRRTAGRDRPVPILRCCGCCGRRGGMHTVAEKLLGPSSSTSSLARSPSSSGISPVSWGATSSNVRRPSGVPAHVGLPRLVHCRITAPVRWRQVRQPACTMCVRIAGCLGMGGVFRPLRVNSPTRLMDTLTTAA